MCKIRLQEHMQLVMLKYASIILKWLSRNTSTTPCHIPTAKVTDEANQMSELAGAKQKGEDKVGGAPPFPLHGHPASHPISWLDRGLDAPTE